MKLGGQIYLGARSSELDFVVSPYLGLSLLDRYLVIQPYLCNDVKMQE